MNIIELAKQAGFFIKDNDAYSPSNQADHELTKYIEAFAELVAAQEREECAKACEEVGQWPSLGPKDCAYAIRERGTT